MSSDSPSPARRLGKTVGVLVAVRAAWRAAWRRSDTEPVPPPMPPESEEDPSERKIPANPRAERVVAAFLILGAVGGFGFTTVYVIDSLQTQWLGLALGLMFACLSVACIVAGKMVVPQEIKVEERGPLLEEDVVDEVVEQIESGAEGVSRRGLLIGAGGVAGAGVAVALATPLASFGPTLLDIHDTPWHRGVRLVDESGKPYLASEIEIGSPYTALPEHGDPENLGSGLIVVKLPPRYLHLPAARRGWAVEGIVAYSKICPHAGCAISEYRYPLYGRGSQQPAFTCPCHYSTFLPGAGGEVIFGPAGRELPQLPLMLDPAGYLAAGGGFREDIGPSWWNVRRNN